MYIMSLHARVLHAKGPLGDGVLCGNLQLSHSVLTILIVSVTDE